MDKVQIYECVLLVLAVIIFGVEIGQEKYPAAFGTLLSLLFGLPVIGRVFNWW